MSHQPTDQELGIHRFQLEDADGNLHEYVVTRHGAERGMRICFQLLGHAAGAIVPLLEPLLSGDASLAGIMKGEDAQALEGVDLSKAALEVKGLFLDSASIGLVKDILSETSRDGAPLRIPTNFDAAYRGNYRELLEATWKVVVYNRFFPLPATS